MERATKSEFVQRADTEEYCKPISLKFVPLHYDQELNSNVQIS